MSCLPLDEDAEVSAWLARKHTPEHATRAAERDLARAWPRALRRPWARVRGQGWGEAGYRLVVPFYDASGALVALHARRVIDSDDGLPKDVTPRDCSTHGLVMACPLARRVLAGDSDARSLLVAITEARAARGDGAALVITEGLTDFLAWAAACSDADEDAPAVLGIVSGSWSPPWGEELAARIPDGVSVCIDTDDDEQGDRYAARIVETLRPRTRSGALPPLRRKRRAQSLTTTA